MKLSANLRASFQKAYFETHGIQLDTEQADALGWYLLDVVGTALTIRARAIHRSSVAPVDTPAHKREPEGDVHPSPV